MYSLLITIWLFNIAMEATVWPIEIDGLPNLQMVDLSMAMLNNQRVNLTIVAIITNHVQ